jgi:hypothetical protein
VGQTIRGPLYDFLRGGPPPTRLSTRRDSRWNAGEPTGGHAKNVGIKIVRLNDIYLALAQQSREAAKLADSIAIIKAC